MSIASTLTFNKFADLFNPSHFWKTKFNLQNIVIRTQIKGRGGWGRERRGRGGDGRVGKRDGKKRIALINKCT